MSEPAAWWSVDEAFARRIVANLRRRFEVSAPKRHSLSAVCFETFDWRLWRAGFGLQRLGDRPLRWVLHTLEDGRVIARSAAPGGSCRRWFWQDFPPGVLRDQLRDVCKERAVVPAGRFRERREHFAILNKDKKTVCRVTFEHATATEAKTKEQRSVAGFRLMPLKGYAQEARAVAACFAEMGCQAERNGNHPARVAFASVGREPLDYSSRTDVSLPRGITAADACRRIHLASLDMAERNLPGIMDDLDTEFLHDFRVALRRSRSALGLVKGVFPRAETDRFERKLADIQRATNGLRDLDVHLLERETFEVLLPPELHAGLDGLFRRLSRERAGAFRKCRRFLASPATRETMEQWRAFLEHPDRGEGDAPRANEPAVALGTRLLRKRLRRILKDGRAIDSKTPDTALHKLRLQVKKLRYLLEFFGSLLPAGEAAWLVKRFRKLQTILGQFNDLCTQEIWVRQRLEEAEKNGDTSAELAASLGGLLSELARARKARRAKFDRAFARLDDPAVRERAAKLFSGKEKRV